MFLDSELLWHHNRNKQPKLLIMKTKTMFNSIFSAVITLSMISCASQNNSTSQDGANEVNLIVTMTSNYCGGAAPPEELLEGLKVPKKFSNQNIFLSTEKGLQENMQELTTSAAGNIKTSLKKGTYYIFLPQKISMKHTSKDRSEKECTEWKNTPNGTFVVGESNNIAFNIHKTCDACGAMRM